MLSAFSAYILLGSTLGIPSQNCDQGHPRSAATSACFQLAPRPIAESSPEEATSVSSSAGQRHANSGESGDEGGLSGTTKAHCPFHCTDCIQATMAIDQVPFCTTMSQFSYEEHVLPQEGCTDPCPKCVISLLHSLLRGALFGPRAPVGRFGVEKCQIYTKLTKKRET